ncbi:MAG: hypothetical protein WCT20_00575 [Candidatus Babeliales bacterium]
MKWCIGKTLLLLFVLSSASLHAKEQEKTTASPYQAKYLTAYLLMNGISEEAATGLKDLLPKLIKILDNLELLEAVAVLLTSTVVLRGYQGLCFGFILYLLKKGFSQKEIEATLGSVIKAYPKTIITAAVSSIALIGRYPELIEHLAKILLLVGGYFAVYKISQNSTLNRTFNAKLATLSVIVTPMANSVLNYLKFSAEAEKKIKRVNKIREGLDLLTR